MLKPLPIEAAQRGSYVALFYTAESPPFIRVTNDENVLVSSFNPAFLNLPVSDTSPRNYEISTSNTKQGVLYTVQIEGYLQNSSSFSYSELQKMANLFFTVKLKTLEGLEFLMSDPVYPASFSFQFEGGDYGRKKKSIKFKFVAKMPYIICQLA